MCSRSWIGLSQSQSRPGANSHEARQLAARTQTGRASRGRREVSAAGRPGRAGAAAGRLRRPPPTGMRVQRVSRRAWALFQAEVPPRAAAERRLSGHRPWSCPTSPGGAWGTSGRAEPRAETGATGSRRPKALAGFEAAAGSGSRADWAQVPRIRDPAYTQGSQDRRRRDQSGARSRVRSGTQSRTPSR